MNDFSTLALPAPLRQALDALGYERPTPVQAASLPALLDGRDVIAQARTGSGKTVAFGLALLAAIDPLAIRLQALVLCPTRELADQVSQSIRTLARFIPNVKVLTLCGGIPLRPQLASLAHMPHVVVGTPGRIQELVDQQALGFADLRVLVLDEADRMLDMGFLDDIRALIGAMPAQRRTLLFSATWPDAIRDISSRFQHEPVEVTLDDAGDSGNAIEQRIHEVDPARRFHALQHLLETERPDAALVFCNTRRDAADVADGLAAAGHSALALHGDLDQRDRDEILVRFANRSCVVLVATDVAARGLDINQLPAVINYELASDADAHLHRIGRTGRAGRDGIAYSLVAPAELQRLRTIFERHGKQLPVRPLPPAKPGNPGPLRAPMATLVIDAGRQDKLRPGDILGALTGAAGLLATQVGKIAVFPTRSYVAVERASAAATLQKLRQQRIKGRNFRVRTLD